MCRLWPACSMCQQCRTPSPASFPCTCVIPHHPYIAPCNSCLICSIAGRVGAANVPGYQQYRSYMDGLFLDSHLAANGAHRGQSCCAATARPLRCCTCGSRPWSRLRFPRSPRRVLNEAKGAVKSSAPRSNVDAAIALAPALLPLSHQHSSLLARTSPACAGNWGIVRTPLGLVYPSWSKVAPPGRPHNLLP